MEKTHTDKLWAELLAQDEAEKKALKTRNKKLKKAGQKKKTSKSKKGKSGETDPLLSVDATHGISGQESTASQNSSSGHLGTSKVQDDHTNGQTPQLPAKQEEAMKAPVIMPKMSHTIKPMTPKEEPKPPASDPQPSSSSGNADAKSAAAPKEKLDPAPPKTKKIATACLLCQRAFPTTEKLKLHEEISKLHKMNLAKAKTEGKPIPKTVQQQEDEQKKKKTEVVSEPAPDREGNSHQSQNSTFMIADAPASSFSLRPKSSQEKQYTMDTSKHEEEVIELGEGGFDVSPEPAIRKQYVQPKGSATSHTPKKANTPGEKQEQLKHKSKSTTDVPRKDLSKTQEESKVRESNGTQSETEQEQQAKEEELKKFLSEADSEAAMEKARERFQIILQAGEMQGAERRLNEFLAKDEIDLAFIKLLELNIHAAKQHGWANKQKVYMYLFEKIQSHLEKKMKGEKPPGAKTPDTDVNATHAPQPSAQVHAPRMLSQEQGSTEEKPAMSCYSEYVDCEGLSHLLGWGKTADKRERKNKQKRRRINQQIKEKVGRLADCLKTKDWAVADRFASPDLIDRVRKEVEAMREYFENSEIWWGKDAEIGAQITVPSVRGDQVLWMCGGHQKDLSQFDSTGEQPKSKGSIEPCDPEIKGKVPLKRFTALRDLLRELDRLVIDHLAEAVGEAQMGVVRERTDCMLAEYKDGARFQRHVDNTSGDGRRLTVLCYLTDPKGWDEANGGALRLDSSASTRGCPIDIAPQPGRLAMFYANKTAHEVRPSYAHRLALTVWYYDSIERTDAVQRAKAAQQENPSSHWHDQQDTEGRRQASRFMKLIVDDTDLDPSSLLQLLREEKGRLSPSALRILAGITGLPSPDNFSGAIEELSIDGLEMMRQEFRKMGV